MEIKIRLAMTEDRFNQVLNNEQNRNYADGKR